MVAQVTLTHLVLVRIQAGQPICEGKLGKKKESIDVWWRAKINGSFMLTLAHLLQESGVAHLQEHQIRVRRIIDSEAGREETQAAMEEMVRETRFDATVEVLVSTEAPLTVIARESARSSHSFIGLSFDEDEPREDPLAEYAPVVDAIKGHILICKNWHDLHPDEPAK